MTSSSSPGAATAPLVSVIIPIRNDADHLGEQLQSLVDQIDPPPFEVVVGDNASTDYPERVIEQFRATLPSLRVVDASARRGASHARNQAAKAARGEVLVFCDADDRCDPRWMSALLTALPSADIVAGRLGIDVLNSTDARAWRPAPRSTHSDGRFAPSGNMALSRELFLSLGGFDEDYPKSHDVEFSRRAVAQGYRIGSAPDALIHYRLRSTVRGVATQAYRSGRATVQMYRDHPDPGQLPPTPSLRRVGWLLLRVPTITSRRRRGIWARVAAEQAGLVVGRHKFLRRNSPND